MGRRWDLTADQPEARNAREYIATVGTVDHIFIVRERSYGENKGMNAMITVPKKTCATVIPFPLERRRSQVKIEAMIELLIDLLPTAERRSRAKIEARIVYLIDLLDAADAADADLEPDEDGEASDDVGTDDAPEWRPWMSARRISRRSSRSHY